MILKEYVQDCNYDFCSSNDYDCIKCFVQHLEGTNGSNNTLEQ